MESVYGNLTVTQTRIYGSKYRKKSRYFKNHRLYIFNVLLRKWPYGLREQKLEEQKLDSKFNTLEGTDILSSERAGAFDNYFTHNTNNGNFLLQALSPTHKGTYFQVRANSQDSTNNARRAGDFKNAIIKYETYLEIDMEMHRYSEVFDWASVILTFAFIAAGWATGPTGWVSGVINAGNAIHVFIELTSRSYANPTRLDHSKSAMEYLDIARKIVHQPGFFDNYEFEIVSGYSG